MKRLITVVLAILALTACGPTPRERYQQKIDECVAAGGFPVLDASAIGADKIVACAGLPR